MTIIMHKQILFSIMRMYLNLLHGLLINSFAAVVANLRRVGNVSLWPVLAFA